MKYFFTTLAINEPYFERALKFHIDLHEKTEKAIFNITTTQKDLLNLPAHTGMTLEELKEKYPKIHITTLEDFNFRTSLPLDMEGNGFIFNLNLKSLALKACLKINKEANYIIFIDGDWNIYDGFEEQKIERLFHEMEENEIDFAFERPARIGDGRPNPAQTFYADKLYDYDCLDVPLWDEAHVTNEQFLAFRNNWKFKVFAQKWEQMMWYTIANNIRNYPDGFEIGIAALESGMKWHYLMLSILRDCFYFYPKYTDVMHVRF